MTQLDSTIGCARGTGVIATWNGELFDVLNPEPHKLKLSVMAHALSMIPRFGGHGRWPYSVAQHLRNCALECERRYPCEYGMATKCLLHDAAEAYCGDVVRPIKLVIHELYSAVEQRVQDAIWDRFASRPTDREIEVIKEIDTAVLITEAKALMRGDLDKWGLPDVPQANVHIEYVAWQWSAKEWMDTYHRLGGLMNE